MLRQAFMPLSLFALFLFPTVSAQAAEKAVIDARVAGALESFYEEVPGGGQLLEAAKGALIFPSVKKGAFFVGGAYGEGALVEGGSPTAYYSTASASFGFQFGGQASTRLLLFMTDEALARFKGSDGWEVGVDADVTLVELGAGAELNTSNLKQPVLGFVYGHKGLLAGVDLNGTKVSRIER